MKKHLLAASLCLSAITSFGNGYQLNLQGLRQAAMGGSGVAWPWDASTIFYNPGALSRLHGVQAYGSMSLYMPVTGYGNINNNAGGETPTSFITRQQTLVPFSLYVGGPVEEGSRVALGMGIYTPFRQATAWDDNWLGKYIVQSVSMKTVFFQPTFSYRVGEGLAIGAGFIYAAGSYNMNAALPVHGAAGPNYDDGAMHLNGNSSGIGYNVGLHLKASDNVQFGLTYRSQVNMNIGSGQATFRTPNSLRDSFPNTNFDTQLPMPQVLSFGVGVRLEQLTLQFDLNYTGWNSIDSVHYDFAQNTTMLRNIHEPRKYNNTLTARFGACYKISKIVAVMAGGAYDPTPVANGFVSPDMPDGDRVVVSFGATVKPIPRLTIIAAFEGVAGSKRNGSYDYRGFSGVYKTESAAPGLAIYYNF
jgi:long-chain fatty acid transport protein